MPPVGMVGKNRLPDRKRHVSEMYPPFEIKDSSASASEAKRASIDNDNTGFAITVNNKTGERYTHESGIVRGFRARTRATTDASFATPGSASRIFLLGPARVAEPGPIRDRREADTIEMELEHTRASVDGRHENA